VGSRLKKLKRAMAGAPIALTGESRWKEDLLALNHLLVTMGFPASSRRESIFPADKPSHFVPGITLTTEAGSVDLTLYAVPGRADAARSVWAEWRRSLPTDPSGTIEPAFFSQLFFASVAADADFVAGIVTDIEAAGITIPKLREHERSGLSPVPTA
jgi:hypothetical protein